MQLEISLYRLRGIATWQPVTKLAGDRVPALESVQFYIEDGKVSACVTDRFRIVYHRFETDSTEHGAILVPMSLIVQFLTAVKSEKNDIAQVTIEHDGERVSLKLRDTEVGTSVHHSSYPAVMSLVDAFTVAEDGDSTMRWNMKLMADIVKFADPSNPMNKDTGWTMEKNGVATSYRFHKGFPGSFGVLFQKMLTK